MVDRIIDTIETDFAEAAEMNRMSEVDRVQMKGRQFLNPGVLHGYRKRAENIPLIFEDPEDTPLA